jgi:hypothetical protein
LYALIYNLFCCYEALQKFKCNDEKEISDMPQLALTNAKIATGMLSMEAVTALVVSIQNATTSQKPKEQIWQKEVNSHARDLFFQEFKHDDNVDIAKTRLYAILAEFNKQKISEDAVAEDSLPQYLEQIRTLLQIFASNERMKDPNLFTDTDLFQCQALRMIAVLCAEECKKENAFMQFCHDEALLGVSFESRPTPLHTTVMWFARQLQEKLPCLKKIAVEFNNSPTLTPAVFGPGSPRLFALPSPKAPITRQEPRGKLLKRQ